MSRVLRVFVMVTTSLLIMTACGGDSDTDEPSTQVWDESTIVEHMGLEVSSSGGSWFFTTDTGITCDVAVVLTSAGQVSLYANAGDTVATNTDESAGLKIVTSERKTCLDAATDLLEDLE